MSRRIILLGSCSANGHYVFRLYADITVNIDLREVIRSIELHPETL